MSYPELAISVSDILGVPRVVLRGTMDCWHDEAISGILNGFADQGSVALVLDIAELSFTGCDAAMQMVRVLRTLDPGACVHVVAKSPTMELFIKARLPQSIRLYSSTDQIAQVISATDELPLAA